MGDERKGLAEETRYLQLHYMIQIDFFFSPSF